MSLSVDFASDAVSGQSGDGRLSVAGDLTGRDLPGVTYRCAPGSLDGLVGGARAFGVFHGNTADLI